MIRLLPVLLALAFPVLAHLSVAYESPLAALGAGSTLLLLLAFIAIVFGLTVVKVLQLGDLREFETFDHVARPQIIPQDATE